MHYFCFIAIELEVIIQSPLFDVNNAFFEFLYANLLITGFNNYIQLGIISVSNMTYITMNIITSFRGLVYKMNSRGPKTEP